MLTIFIYAHCVYMWSLFLYTLTVFTYAHCFYICSLNLHMLTVFRFLIFLVISLHSSKYHCVLVNIPFMLLLHAAVHYMLTVFLHQHRKYHQEWTYLFYKDMQVSGVNDIISDLCMFLRRKYSMNKETSSTRTAHWQSFFNSTIMKDLVFKQN
jgi:hypothetical protein